MVTASYTWQFTLSVITSDNWDPITHLLVTRLWFELQHLPSTTGCVVIPLSPLFTTKLCMQALWHFVLSLGTDLSSNKLKYESWCHVTGYPDGPEEVLITYLEWNQNENIAISSLGSLESRPPDHPPPPQPIHHVWERPQHVKSWKTPVSSFLSEHVGFTHPNIHCSCIWVPWAPGQHSLKDFWVSLSLV